MRKAGLILLSTFGFSLAACSATLPPVASTPAASAVSSFRLAGVTLTLPAPSTFSPQYLNLNKTTRIDVQIDSGPVTSYTLGSALAPCNAGTCTINLGLLSPQSHTFKVSSYGVAPATNTTTLISQGSLIQVLTAGTNNALSLTLTPVNATSQLSSAVKQYNTVSKTFGNTVKFPTRGGRSLPAYYDVLVVDSVGDTIPAVLCGNDASVVITNISNAAHAKRFRVEVQAVGAHILSVQAGTVCTSGAATLTTQAVTGVSTGVQTIASGGSHSLALLADGTVRAWGFNGIGLLGNTGIIGGSSAVPVTVDTLSDVVSLSAGGGHSLALLSDGTVRAWGANRSGQLGNGTTTDSTIPVTVNMLSDVVGLSAGSNHSQALRADGTVRAWGFNGFGQFGNGTTTNSSIPVTVDALSDVVSLSAGDSHSLALLADGTVRAWGTNRFGQLGNGTTTNSLTLVKVSGLSNVIGLSLSSSGSHSLALLADGTVRAWGKNNYGQLGNGTTTDSSTPVEVSGLTNVVSLSGGFNHSLALLVDGTVRAWGANGGNGGGNIGQLGGGQLGNGTKIDSSIPVTVNALSDVVRLSAGSINSLALLSDGTMRAWGTNSSGQLGNGTKTDSTIPVTVSISDVMQPTP